MFNVGDKVRVLHTATTEYEAGYEGVVVEVGPLDNGEDYLVNITDRSNARGYQVDPNFGLAQSLMQALTGDTLSYPEAALERI